MKIVTRYDQLPIETRSFDWTATMDNYQPGDPVGKGQTEKDAIGDLLTQVGIKDYEALGLVEPSFEERGPQRLEHPAKGDGEIPATKDAEQTA
jgi:hypothetical protein